MTDSVSPAPARHAGRNAIFWIIKIGVSSGLLYWLLRQVDVHRLWQVARTASLPWLAVSLVLFFVMILVSAWRWGLLLGAQDVRMSFGALTASWLVATFFNNFLPSNIGGDVIRIRDTARAAGSKTLAATVVLLDRGIGLLGLIFVAATGATLAARNSEAIGPVGPGLLWAARWRARWPRRGRSRRAIGRLLRRSARRQEWVDERLERLTSALARFARRALVNCFTGAIAVRASSCCSMRRLRALPDSPRTWRSHPASFIVQMLPVSVNGWGLRESTYGALPAPPPAAGIGPGAVVRERRAHLLFSVSAVALPRAAVATAPASRHQRLPIAGTGLFRSGRFARSGYHRLMTVGSLRPARHCSRGPPAAGCGQTADQPAPPPTPLAPSISCPAGIWCPA